jgi:undecaprenyl-diphosphatase
MSLALRVKHNLVWARRFAGRLEWSVLLLIGVTGALIWTFLKLAALAQSEPHGFDTRLILALRNPADPSDPIGPGWMEEMVRDFSALGSTGVLIFLALAVVGYLVMAGMRHAAWLVAASISSGLIFSHLLKWMFERPRPDLVPHATEVYTSSFPSGHAMMSALVYLTLGALLARLHSARRVKLYVLNLAILLTGFVGISRVYLGVHWPTDVLAGWSIGAAWALIWWMLALYLQSEGKVESAAR